MATATKTRRRSRRRGGRRKVAPSRRELVRSAWPELRRDFADRGLIVYASALAFQVVSAIVPFLLFGIALIGFLDMKDLWTQHVAPQIRPDVSAAAFTVINHTVTQVLTQKQVFWLTGGFALAIWQMSGGVRVIVRGLDAIYEAVDRRSWRKRTLTSLALAVVVSVLVFAATAAVWLLPLAYGKVGAAAGVALFFVRWGLAAVLLGLATGLVIQYAPDSPQPAGWVSFGSLLTVGSWIVASLVFGVYIRYVSSVGSVFGSLATLVVAIAYIYITTTVFFVGAQMDAIIRERVEGNPQGR